MRKSYASTTIAPELSERVKSIAEADDRTEAYVLALAIEVGLPIVERKLLPEGLPKKPRAKSSISTTVATQSPLKVSIGNAQDYLADKLSEIRKNTVREVRESLACA